MDKVLHLEIRAQTMREAAQQFSRQIGERLALGRDYDPDEKLQDEFLMLFPRAPVGKHIEELRESYIVDIRWERDHFVLYKVPLR